ncbi:ribose transport system substrate-binding protein [Weissella beninensis]|uniref:D-ribose ABC transporter substrate-binding protein n=1 Tax=Periweissella beninensis TaxID=504936 RepID=A0ABT0VJS5_9LACO|nr:D-ribose ABC transporter substrate-binding protein [Periweissella beninensis]MBM7544591.1 ribose transport system substrate-binding protein [Periweissella beninensis]MCM2438090.1 D-ribose ABC transporter substrate-binding protein [Periweissella beninensis]
MQIKTKTWFFIGLSLISTLFLTGCSIITLENPYQKSEKIIKKSPSKLKVGVSLSTLNNPFFISIKNGVNNAAQKNKTNVQISDAQNDTAKQNNDVEDMIQKKVDVLIINPVDSSAITPEVKAANDTGIPVITIDRSSDGGNVLTLVASDSRKGGKMAAQFMIEQLGKNAQIAELQGIPGASATRERGGGFDDAVKGKLNIVTKQTASFDRAKGMTTTENIVQGHPNIKGIFAQNDEMALGAVQALKGNKNIILVGFDGSEDGLSAVKKGQMTATVAQKPYKMGQLAMQAAYDHFAGKKVSKNIASPLQLVVNKNYK